jgi:hypothetical protein
LIFVKGINIIWKHQINDKLEGTIKQKPRSRWEISNNMMFNSSKRLGKLGKKTHLPNIFSTAGMGK